MKKELGVTKRRRLFFDIESAGIYKITSPTNKVYIGQSWNIGNRWNSYSRLKCKAQPKIYNSLIKYGVENHLFELVHLLPNDVSQDVLNNYEIIYWELHKDCNIEMMNLREPTSRGKLSQESKQKMRDKKIGIPLSEKHRSNISKTNKGKSKPIGFGERISIAKKGFACSEDTKRKISKKLTGRVGTPISEKTKEILRNYHTGRKLSKESIDKRTATRKSNALLKNKTW
jgi:group I intron endonuclease